MGELDEPIVLERDYWALTKLWHAVDALYMWEFFSTLDYEWSVIRGRRPYRWTIWIYSLTRVATLVAAVLNIIGLDIATPIHCQVWVVFNFSFAYLSLACASLLVVLRVIAIWDVNKAIVVLAISVWGANVSFLSEGAARIRAGWDSQQNCCVILDAESNKPTMIVMLATDIILLLTMFVGLIRLLGRGGGTYELGRLLWRQGIIWLVLGTAAELTPVLFICLYLNDAMNIMFLMPALLTMSIAATRMYRTLSDAIISIDLTNGSDSLPRGDCPGSGTKMLSGVRPSSGEMNVRAVNPLENYLLPQPARYASILDIDGLLGEHPRRASSDEEDPEAALQENRDDPYA